MIISSSTGREKVGGLSRSISQCRGKSFLDDYGSRYVGRWTALRLPDCLGIFSLKEFWDSGVQGFEDLIIPLGNLNPLP